MNDSIIREGFLCSFDINQARMARKEISVILNTLYTNKEGEMEIIESNEETRESDKSTEKHKNNKKPNFVYEKLGSIKNLCLIFNNTNGKPTEIFKELQNQSIQLKYIKKLIPLDMIVTKDFKKYLTEYLINKDIENSFKIFYRSRCSDKEYKEDIFKIILQRYADKKVDLENPTYGIYIEVVTKYIGFSVIKN